MHCMSALPPLPRYDPRFSYDWNYDRAPEPAQVEFPPIAGSWTFCGLDAASPLGVPAGPLLNGRWVLYYASLGFDVLTYKTVRSSERPCYPLPNLLPVATGPLRGGEATRSASATMQGSWAVSFGMPSKAPAIWRVDVDQTRTRLEKDKILCVSVVGTVPEDWTIDELADDYALCARWAVESGADCIEANFSCPNVATCDGQLYQNHESAKCVAERVQAAVDGTPFLIKIGHMTDRAKAAQLVTAVAPFASALSMTNSVATSVRSPSGELYFGGQPRGICGEATRDASIEQTRLFAEIVAARAPHLRIIGVGGARTAQDVRDYLRAGAESVQIATAAMVDPLVAVRIRQNWGQ